MTLPGESIISFVVFVVSYTTRMLQPRNSHLLLLAFGPSAFFLSFFFFPLSLLLGSTLF